MANNLSSNVTRKLARVFLDSTESNRILTKGINTQLLAGKFKADSGTVVDFKRPHDYVSERTAKGDISGSTKSAIISGKASGVVQDFFTVSTEWDIIEEALELDQLEEILRPMAIRMMTDLELDIGKYMMNNCALSYGTPGTPVSKWSDIAGAGALLTSLGIPTEGGFCYAVNPFTQTALADTQTGLSGDGKVRSAWEKAVIQEDFAGMRVMSSNALKARTSSSMGGDRAGAVASATATYVAHKDSMIQAIAVDGFTGTPTIKAGEIIQIAGRYRVSLSTREPIFDAAGNKVLYRGVVTEDVVLAAGAGTIFVAGPAIYEANGQYNTVEAALADGDVLTILGADATTYQPNLFFQRQAFGMGTVKLPKLYSTDTVATTEDGMSIRVSRYADGDANVQKVRFDLLPAYATFNPFFAGQGYGVPA